jgi:hypothetical protein
MSTARWNKKQEKRNRKRNMVVMTEDTLSVSGPDKISSSESSFRGSSSTNLNTSIPAVVHKSRKSLFVKR